MDTASSVKPLFCRTFLIGKNVRNGSCQWRLFCHHDNCGYHIELSEILELIFRKFNFLCFVVFLFQNWDAAKLMYKNTRIKTKYAKKCQIQDWKSNQTLGESPINIKCWEKSTKYDSKNKYGNFTFWHLMRILNAFLKPVVRRFKNICAAFYTANSLFISYSSQDCYQYHIREDLSLCYVRFWMQ